MSGEEEIKQTQFSENMRFYGDMRFKQLTLLMAAMTAAGAGVAQYPQLSGPIAAAAAVFRAVMWVMEIRSTLYWVAFKEKVPTLWPSAKVTLWKQLNATNVVLFLHAFFYGF